MSVLSLADYLLACIVMGTGIAVDVVAEQLSVRRRRQSQASWVNGGQVTPCIGRYDLDGSRLRRGPRANGRGLAWP